MVNRLSTCLAYMLSACLFVRACAALQYLSIYLFIYLSICIHMQSYARIQADAYMHEFVYWTPQRAWRTDARMLVCLFPNTLLCIHIVT